MLTPVYPRKFLRYSLSLMGLVALLSVVASSTVLAQDMESHSVLSRPHSVLPSAYVDHAAQVYLPRIAGEGSSPVLVEQSSIVEISRAEQELVAALDVGIATATLVNTVNTYEIVPPSPDPVGIIYLANSNSLLFVDAKVEETAIYSDVNTFEMSLSGTLSATYTTTFSSEPTGVTEDPASGRLFFSDDIQDKIFEIDVGGDGQLGGGDDTVTSFDTGGFGSNDPEGVTYDTDQNVLFVVDGQDREVYRVAPGPNGLFDGVDDVVTSFDTLSLGIDTPHGIAYDPANGYLYLTSKYRTLIAHVTTAGELVRWIDIATANAINPDGLAYAPASSGGGKSIYISDRGKDSAPGDIENDGRVFEFSVPALTPGNTAPTVDAGADQSVALPAVANLDGTVGDDGTPGALTTTWSTTSGPGAVTFGNASAVDTTASFSLPGVYVLNLMADDGELAASDQVTITATGKAAVAALDIPVSSSSDDAEESLTKVKLKSADLDLLQDADEGTDPVPVTAVGLRFNEIVIPQGTTIANAYVQFVADKTSSGATLFTIEGQAADNPSTFVAARSNITSRPRTTESVEWAPPAWTAVDDAGNDQRTPDITAIIQELVNRPNWEFGNSLVLIFTGNEANRRVAKAFDRDGLSGAPTLHIEFLTDNQAPTVNAGPDQTVRFSNSVTLDGTVSDDDLPNPPNTVTTTWSKVSGPGTVIFDDVNAIDTTAIFTETGVYQLQLTASDGQLSASAEVEITIDSGIRFFNGQIAASSDDAEEKDSGGLSLTSTDLDILLDVSGETEREQVAVGLRFTGVDIPDEAQIINAYVQFQADEKDFAGTELTVFGEAADNAETFVEEKENISSRSRTDVSVLWEPEPWTKAGEAGPDQRTANIASVIQEIVNRPGWSANNSLVIIITGEGRRTAEAYDGSESGAPRLFVEYSIDKMSYMPTIAAR